MDGWQSPRPTLTSTQWSVEDCGEGCHDAPGRLPVAKTGRREEGRGSGCGAGVGEGEEWVRVGWGRHGWGWEVGGKIYT